MKNLKLLAIMLTTFFVMPPTIISACQARGYLAVGGEWLIVPLIALIAYAFIPSIKQLYKECFKKE